MMRLSRLEKNKKAIEESEYRDKFYRNKKYKLTDKENNNQLYKDSINSYYNRSTSNYQIIKKVNSYSITKITTDTIEKPKDNNNNSDQKPVINYKKLEFEEGKRLNIDNNVNNVNSSNIAINSNNNEYIKSVYSIRRDEKISNHDNNTLLKKPQTKSTTADINSNNSENDSSYIKINIGYSRVNKNSSNSINLELMKNEERESQEYVLNEKLLTPVSKDNNNNNNNNNNNETNDIEIINQINNKATTQTTNSTNTEAFSTKYKSVMSEKLDKIISNLNTEIENIKKSQILHVDYSSFNNTIPELDCSMNNSSFMKNDNNTNHNDNNDHNDNEIIDDENNCCFRELQTDSNNNNYDANNKNTDSNICMCCMCSSGEITETFLGDQIFHIINDIYNCHIKNDKVEQTIVKYKKLVHGFCSIEEKKEIIFFVKLFYQKVAKALETIKLTLFKKPEIAEFRNDFQEVITNIEECFKNNDWAKIFSSMESEDANEEDFQVEMKEFESNPVKFIIMRAYKDQWDGVIYSLFSEIFHIYKSIIEASSSISEVFSPGIMKIEYFTGQQVFLEDFHKEIFEDIFLKDIFIRNIIEVLRKKDNYNDGGSSNMKKIVEQVEAELKKPHPESEKLILIIQSEGSEINDLLNYHYNENDNSNCEEEYEEVEQDEEEEDKEVNEEDEQYHNNNNSQNQQYYYNEENEINEEGPDQQCLELIYKYAKPKLHNYQNQNNYLIKNNIKKKYFNLINFSSKKKSNEEDNDSNDNDNNINNNNNNNNDNEMNNIYEEVEDEMEEEEEEEEFYINKSKIERGYYSSSDKYYFNKRYQSKSSLPDLEKQLYYNKNNNVNFNIKQNNIRVVNINNSKSGNNVNKIDDGCSDNVIDYVINEDINNNENVETLDTDSKNVYSSNQNDNFNYNNISKKQQIKLNQIYNKQQQQELNNADTQGNSNNYININISNNRNRQINNIIKSNKYQIKNKMMNQGFEGYVDTAQIKNNLNEIGKKQCINNSNNNNSNTNNSNHNTINNSSNNTLLLTKKIYQNKEGHCSGFNNFNKLPKNKNINISNFEQQGNNSNTNTNQPKSIFYNNPFNNHPKSDIKISRDVNNQQQYQISSFDNSNCQYQNGNNANENMNNKKYVHLQYNTSKQNNNNSSNNNNLLQNQQLIKKLKSHEIQKPSSLLIKETNGNHINQINNNSNNKNHNHYNHNHPDTIEEETKQAQSQIEIDELVRIIDATGNSNTKKNKHNNKKKKDKKENNNIIVNNNSNSNNNNNNPRTNNNTKKMTTKQTTNDLNDKIFLKEPLSKEIQKHLKSNKLSSEEEIEDNLYCDLFKKSLICNTVSWCFAYKDKTTCYSGETAYNRHNDFEF